MSTSPVDTLGRPVRDLRISITDRCNFRCSYCMPKEVFGAEHPFLPREEILTYEEIARLARLFVDLGARKLRITGGEPLLRRDVEVVVRHLAAIDGVDDLALTTNGSALAALAPTLADAGLHRVTVSLDAVDGDVFRRMNDVDFPVERVLQGIAAAADAGLGPVKLNMVVRRGVNEDQILPMAEYARDHGHVLRFIEFMDVGTTNGWRLEDVVPATEILARLREVHEIEPVDPSYRGEVARRWRYRDGGGEIGLITSVTHPFCGDCSRVRLSAEGKVYTCLFAATGHDLKAPLRAGASDEALRAHLEAIWRARADRYSERRFEDTASDGRIEMSYIGG